MSRDAFVAQFGDVFEHSPWIAEAVWVRGLGPEHDTADGLHAAMVAQMRRTDDAAKLRLIGAHPDLAGHLAVDGGLTAASSVEQASAGLDRCTPAEFERFQELNQAYKAKFGFPFIMAVKGRSRAEILAAFERRIQHDPEQEFATALGEIETIARLRLVELLS